MFGVACVSEGNPGTQLLIAGLAWDGGTNAGVQGPIRLSNPDVTFRLVVMDVQEGSGLPRMVLSLPLSPETGWRMPQGTRMGSRACISMTQSKLSRVTHMKLCIIVYLDVVITVLFGY